MIARMKLAPGTSTSAELVVSEADLASALKLQPGDDFPPVFATSRLVALMEIAATRALVALLEPGQLSVGVSVEIMHGAATPPGAKVVAEARFTGMEGKLFVFEVSARDPGGEIGRGIHKRAIISTERLMASAAKRGG
jgi:fluoroacetyl-CoA thioesterase